MPWEKKDEQQPPVTWRELLALLVLVVLCDLTMYRGYGWAGYALLFAAAPVILALGVYRPRFGRAFWIVAAMLLVLAAKMVWCAPWLGWLVIVIGFALAAACVMALTGRTPHVLATLVYVFQTIPAGCMGLDYYGRRLSAKHTPAASVRWWSVVLPLVTLLAFGLIFIVANPDVLKHVWRQVEIFFDYLREWLANFSAWEVVFWIAVAWIGVGLLRPAVARLVPEERAALGEATPAPLFVAYRNTLAAVIILFAVYLVFEFGELWFRKFPRGFYYSGYAHQGAAWLTVALGLATAILSFIFSGSVLRDPRVGQLRRLAWIWSVQNLVLAAAVYNRMGIYVGFNGMTRMRIVGYLGISAVVVGFLLVLVKIARDRSFGWLVRRQMWTLAAALYLLTITPVDTIAVRYNVGRMLAGDLKPSVQITEHPISAEGITLLAPLLECDNATIREGIRALLSQRDEDAEQAVAEQTRLGWTSYQMADHVALDWFRGKRARWDTFANPGERKRTYDAFRAYAYQWY